MNDMAHSGDNTHDNGSLSNLTLTVKILICIRKLTASNQGQDTGHSEVWKGRPQSFLEEDIKIALEIRSHPLQFTLFSFHYSLNELPRTIRPYAVWATHYLTNSLEVSLKNLQSLSYSGIFQQFMESQGSCSRKLSTGRYREPDQATLYHRNVNSLRSLLILSSHVGLGRGLFSSDLPT
jgi:hypothetical protein